MRKALIMQFQGYRSSFVSSIYIYIYKYKLKTILPHQWHHTSISGFHYHWQLYCLINRQYRKTWKKTTRLRTIDSLWGETTVDHWNLHPKGQQSEKCSSCNSSISGLLMLERLITHNRENKWASWDAIILATLLFVQQLIQVTMQESINIPH